MGRLVLIFMILVGMSSTAVAVSDLPEVEVLPDDLVTESVDLGAVSEDAVSPLAVGDYGVGTSYVEIFAGSAVKLPWGVNYVYWRDSQYVYRMVYGYDLSYSGGTFRGSDLEYIEYDVRGSGWNDNVPQFTSGTDSSFSLSPGTALVWSNLGPYPTLTDGGGMYAQLAAFCLVGYGVFYLLRRIVWRCFGG